MKTMKTWKKLTHNYVLNFKDFYISYNPNTGLLPGGKIITDLINSINPNKNVHNGEETALKDLKTGKFYILTGDFRKEYEKCKTLKQCLAVYKKNIKSRNNYSTD